MTCWDMLLRSSAASFLSFCWSSLFMLKVMFGILSILFTGYIILLCVFMCCSHNFIYVLFVYFFGGLMSYEKIFWGG